MKSTLDNPQPSHRLSGPFFFPDLDEFAFALFVRWLYGGTLHGPTDFHSMNHYVCLYCLANRFQVEELKNRVMDLVRHYYHQEDMTAPAFRLFYVYSVTEGPNMMKQFLVTTAAYRALAENEKPGGPSASLKAVLKRGGDVASDFAQALIRLVKNDKEDVRKGNECAWHEHNVTPKCKAFEGFEP